MSDHDPMESLFGDPKTPEGLGNLLTLIDANKTKPEPTTWDYKNLALAVALNIFCHIEPNKGRHAKTPSPEEYIDFARKVEAFLHEGNT